MASARLLCRLRMPRASRPWKAVYCGFALPTENCGVFDVKPMLPGRCYLPLESDALFQTARVSCGVVIRVKGVDIDPGWLCEDGVPVF